jgi:hypothetical protein
MVSVPVLAAPALFATLNVTAPLLVPVAPDVTVIQVAPLVEVHWHVPVTETATVAVPPAAGMFWLVGEMLALQVGGAGGALTPAWVILGRWLAIAIALLLASPGFGATVKLTVPLPLPLADEDSAIQLASDTADHEQSLVVTMLMLPAPPFELTVWLDGPRS